MLNHRRVYYQLLASFIIRKNYIIKSSNIRKKSKASATTLNEKKTCKETHRIRVFVIEEGQPMPELRSAERYRTIMRLIRTQQFTSGIYIEQDTQRGYLGPCLLADLAFFDQGQGFMSDSLHTVYGGAMVNKIFSCSFLSQ